MGRRRRRFGFGKRALSILDTLRRIADYLATWDEQETSGTVAGADNIGVTVPDTRDVALNTYADYTAGANWSNPSGQIARHTAGSVETLQQDGILAAGKTWQATITIANRTAGSVTITDGGAAISANEETTRTIASTGADFIITPTSDFDGDIDVAILLVQQTDILASSAGLGLWDGTHSGVAVGQTGQYNIPIMAEYDGIGSNTPFCSAELNSAMNFETGTIMIPVRVANVGVWTDGSQRNMVTYFIDGDNRFYMAKRSVDNVLFWVFVAGGIVTIVASPATNSDVDVFLMTMKWESGFMTAYKNDTQIGTPQAIGTLVGNLDYAIIGAATTIPTNVWHGKLAYATIYTRALTQPEIQRIMNSMGIPS